jgi:hypothetical protein
VDADGSSSKERAASTLPAAKESLWVLERADNLLGEIAASIWLSLASVWRIPRAAVARDSIDRMEALVISRRALPPRLNLLVASITSALFLAWQVSLPEQAPHQILDTSLRRIATTSPENLLLVSAPALVSLWLTVIACSRLLRQAAGGSSREPTGVLMQVTSAVTILSCLGIIGVLAGEARLNTVRRGLPDLAIITGFWLMMALPAVAGARCAQQMTASSGCSRRRRRALRFVVGPLAFIGSVLVALVVTYYLLQSQALVARMIDEGNPPSSPSAVSPTCYVMSESVVCQVLLSAPSDLAIGMIRQVDIEWRDLRREGNLRKVALLPQNSQIVQLAPHPEPGGLWILHAKEPLPVAFQIATPDACHLYQEIAAFRQRVKPLPHWPPSAPPSPPLELEFTIYWQPGFGLVPRKDAAASFVTSTELFAASAFDTGLASLCGEGLEVPSRSNGRK